jgi:hypothetical protein
MAEALRSCSGFMGGGYDQARVGRSGYDGAARCPNQHDVVRSVSIIV